MVVDMQAEDNFDSQVRQLHFLQASIGDPRGKWDRGDNVEEKILWISPQKRILLGLQ